MTTRIYPAGHDPADDDLPFAPVYAAMRGVMTGEKPLSLEQVVDGVVSIVVTAALNIHVSLKDRETPEQPAPGAQSIANMLCFHIMKATQEAVEKAREEIGLGATKQ